MRAELETTTINDKQAHAVEAWLEANSKVPGWLDGYALGQSYIDTRANGGKGITQRRRYVQLDHQVAREVPELAGFSAQAIREFMGARVPDAEPTEGGLKLGM